LLPGHNVVSAGAYEESLRASPGLKRGGSRLSKLGGLESRCKSTSGPDLLAAGDVTVRSPPGRAATGSSCLPPGSCIVQELDLQKVEFAAAAFVPLRVNPDPEGMFTL
jgi:hypothetical protein